jgi:hypothetical protein
VANAANFENWLVLEIGYESSNLSSSSKFMSQFHNSLEGERVAKRFHVVCFFVGMLHIAAGMAMMVWHGRGYKDHEDNIQRIKGGSA